MKKLEEARAEKSRLQAIQDESDIAATSYRVSAMQKEQMLENMSELDSESIGSKAFIKSQQQTEKKTNNRSSRGSQAPFSTNRGGEIAILKAEATNFSTRSPRTNSSVGSHLIKTGQKSIDKTTNRYKQQQMDDLED